MSTDAPHNISQLLRRLAAGDEDALIAWYDQYYTSIVFFAKSMIRNQSEAEDIALECFVRLWHHRASMESEQKLRGFLFTVARNSCLDYLKHERVRVRVHEELIDRAVTNAFAEANIITADLLKAIYAQIEALSPDYRNLIKMLYLEGLSSAEVAKRLQITQENLRQRKSRAIQRLKNLLLEKGIDGFIIFLFFVSRSVS